MLFTGSMLIGLMDLLLIHKVLLYTDFWIRVLLAAGEGYVSNVSLFSASFSQILVFLYQLMGNR
jgi:hypothetical protein